MKNNQIIEKVNMSMNRFKFKVQKHSPELLLITGVIGVGISTVLACKATLKINDILEEAKDTVEAIHDFTDNPREGIVYTEKDAQKDLFIAYSQTGVKLVKLYAPAIILGTFSISSIAVSNNILRKRNIAIAAAYATIDKSFKEYRTRVADRFGQDVEHEIRYDIKSEEVTETTVNAKGKEKTEKKTVKSFDSNNLSDYARVFDSSNPNWNEDPEYNIMFLKLQQQYCTDKLRANGHLFLNEVYDALGIDRVNYGQAIGWVYEKDNPIGDNFVDFGLYNTEINNINDIASGKSNSIILDFNPDGNIWERM